MSSFHGKIPGLFGLILALACLCPTSADAEKWGSETPEGLGITQTEFRIVKETGMSKSFLLLLLEIGIRPNEYFKQPWKQLGVTEAYWLNQRRSGMCDDDINRSFHQNKSGEMAPLISFVLPGYYHYQTQRPITGGLITALAVGSVGVLIVNKENRIYPAATLIASMIWSATDAFIHTRFADNQDARRFSFNLQADPTRSEFQLALRF